MSTKQSLKQIQVQIKDGELEGALHNATSLLKSLKKDDPDAASVLCYRGLALSHLQRSEEAEKCYTGAYKLKPDHPLASKALKQLYVKNESWEQLGMFLERLVQDAYEANDGEACASSLHELLQLRQTHGPEDRLYLALSLLLPSSPLIPLFSSLKPPSAEDATYTPFSRPIYPPPSLSLPPSLPNPLPHPLHLTASLALLLNLLIRQQSIIRTTIKKDVSNARTKISAKSEKESERTVEGKILGGEMGGRLVELLKEVAGHPETDEEVRRGVEGEEFAYWRKLVGVVGDDVKDKEKKTKATPVDAAAEPSIPPAALFMPDPYTQPTKSQALSRADTLASGFILLQLSHPSAEGAYEWVLEGTDAKDIYYPIDLLHQYASKYPESPMGEFVDDYCRWFGLIPPPSDEDETGVNKVDGQGYEGKDGSTEDEVKKDAQKAKAKKWKKGKKGMNARERRKARRIAGQEGTLSEDMEAEERDELVADMTKLLDKLPKSIFAHRVMASISLQEDDLANAVAYAEKGRLLLKALQTERGITLPFASASLDTALGIALVPYYAPKHHIRATRLLTGAITFDANNNEARFARAQIHQHSGAWAKAREGFQQVLDLQPEEKLEMATTEEIGWCLVNEGKLEEGRDVLEEVAQRRTNKWIERGEKEGDDASGRARVWYRLGKTEWMIDTQESKSQAEEWFTTSLRALPTYAPSYTALGLVFADAGDEERSQKCFQKAFELDATEADAAERLARGYANDDEWALVRAIATRVMEGEGGVEGVQGGDTMSGKGRFAPKNGWAWKALGSTEMYYRNFVKASQSFQIALRALPDDVATHVLLAEAYIKSGKHIAALKTLNHVLTLDPEHWMAKYDIALIHVELGHFADAIAIYEQLNIAKPSEVGTLAALAGARLSQGREMLSGGFRQRAKHAFLEASAKAQDVIRLDRQYRTWGWKVVADAAFEINGLGMDEEDLEVLASASELLAEQDEDKRAVITGVRDFGDVLAENRDLANHEGADGTSAMPLRLAIRAFTWRAYLLRDERAPVVMSALYDQAAALHMLVRATSEEGEKMAAAKSAITALRRALEKDSSDERLWNALGVLCAEGGKAVAQHAFVVSLDLYTKDPITWTNLGYLYLQLDDRELANQCFYKSQTLDPDYARAWLGQGFLAQKEGDGPQASSLFAHAVTLAAGSLLEADLAAAATLYERYMIPGHYDVGELHQPAFALKRYIHRRPRDSAAVHLYGLISEKLGMVDEAQSAFETSVSLLEHEFEQTESEAIEKRYAMALANLGRVRLASGAYDQAIEAFTSCWDLVQDSPVVANGGNKSNGAASEDAAATGTGVGQTAGLKTQVKLGIAIAKYWTGDVEACLEEFENALAEAEGSHVKGMKDCVVVLLARTLWSLGEEGKEVAKGHLMECLSSESPDINVISALGAVALATSDSDLLDAVSSELGSMPPHKRFEDRSDLAGLVLSTASMLSTDENVDGAANAARDLAEAIEAAPWNTTIRARLARLYLASGRPQDARDILLMDTRETEAELMALRGMARVQMGEKRGLGEIMKSVRAEPWKEERWDGLGWGVGASEGLEDEVFEPEQEGLENEASG